MPKPGKRGRRVPDAEPVTTFVLFVEGDTEKEYFTHWARRLRGRVIINVDPDHGDPKHLVKLAVAEAKAGRANKSGPPTFVWCVYDVDEHVHVVPATDKAWANQVPVALSDPCFEIWLYLHRVDHTAPIHRHDLQRNTQTVVGCDKHIPEAIFDALLPLHETATHRAIASYKRNFENDSLKPHDSNPSTNVWELTAALRAFDSE